MEPKPECILDGCHRPQLARGLCSADYQRAKANGTLDELSPPMRTTCEQCSGPIPKGRRYGAKFCSADCKNKAMDAAKHAALVAARAARARTCAWCKESLSDDARFGTRFCSGKCSDDWNNHQKALSAQRAKRAVRQPCEVCSGPIPPSRNASAIYCSAECKIRSQRSVSTKARRGQQEYNRRYLYDLTSDQYAAMLASQDGKCAICRTDTWERGKDNKPHVDHSRATGRVRGILCGGCNNGLGNFGDDPARLRAAADYLEATIVWDATGVLKFSN